MAIQSHPAAASKPKLLEQVRMFVRARRYSLRTEQAFIDGIERFIIYHGKRHPGEMDEEEITALQQKFRQLDMPSHHRKIQRSATHIAFRIDRSTGFQQNACGMPVSPQHGNVKRRIAATARRVNRKLLRSESLIGKRLRDARAKTCSKVSACSLGWTRTIGRWYHYSKS